MEEAVAEHLVEEGGSRLAQQIFDPMPGREERRPVIDVDPRDPLDRQYGAACTQPIDTGNTEAGITGEILAEFGGGSGLEAQIHLDSDHLGERLHDLNRLQPPKRG